MNKVWSYPETSQKKAAYLYYLKQQDKNKFLKAFTNTVLSQIKEVSWSSGIYTSAQHIVEYVYWSYLTLHLAYHMEILHKLEHFNDFMTLIGDFAMYFKSKHYDKV